MVPEKASAIFDRAALYANNRAVAGVHYPTDVEAGRISWLSDRQCFSARPSLPCRFIAGTRGSTARDWIAVEGRVPIAFDYRFRSSRA
jgi:hypothetical protein